MSEVVILTQFSRKLYLMFILLVPPSIAGVLVIKINIFILVPTLTIIFPFFPIPSRLLVSPSSLTIAQKVHSPFGWVETKPWLFLKQID